MSRSTRVVRIGVLAVCVTAAIAWALGRFGPPAFAPAVVASYAPPLWYLLPLSLAACVAAAARDVVGAAASLSSLLVVSFAEGASISGARPVVGVESPSVRVLTYNVAKWERGAAAIAKAIESTNADVVCLEEAGRYFWLSGDDQNPDALARALPGYHFVGEEEIAIASRLPIRVRHTAPLAPGPASRPIVEAVVETSGGEISVVAVHFVPTLLGESSAPDRGEAARGALGDIAHVRLRQAAVVLAYIRSIERPVVLCGDLNAPPTAAPPRLLATYLVDAWAERGTGFGWTEPTSFPHARIDYVFARGLDVREVRVIDATASDHRPVLALLGWPTKR